MQIRRFEARNMADALRTIKKEFGAEAVILAARNVGRKGGLLNRGRSAVEITAAIDNPPGDAELPAAEQAADLLCQTAPPAFRVQLSGRGRQLSPSGQPTVGQPSEAAAPAIQAADPCPADPLPDLRRQLRSQGLDPEAIGMLCAGGPGPGSDARRAEDLLAGCIRRQGLAGGDLRPRTGHPSTVALVGASGVGKTTAVAKLAVHLALRRGLRVGMIAADHQRVGAMGQMQTLAAMIGLPLESAATAEQLHRARQQLQHVDVILVDTPAIHPLDDDPVHPLRALFARTRAPECLLVLSAATKHADLNATIAHLEKLPVAGAVITKLDETFNRSEVFSAVITHRLPVRYLSDGAQVAADLAPASAERLAGWMLDLGGGRQAGLDAHEPPEPAAPPVPPEPGADVFVANRMSDVFHRGDCKSVERIKAENIVIFQSEAEACDAGFKPCRSCVLAPGQHPDLFFQRVGRRMTG
jgi:flagellar biosynthesis protein FlhF